MSTLYVRALYVHERERECVCVYVYVCMCTCTRACTWLALMPPRSAYIAGCLPNHVLYIHCGVGVLLVRGVCVQNRSIDQGSCAVYCRQYVCCVTELLDAATTAAVVRS
jgi:hypothetical protein